jgi:hypothetical protein
MDVEEEMEERQLMGVKDIDLFDHSDPLLVTTYVNEIYSHLRLTEVSFARILNSSFFSHSYRIFFVAHIFP